MISPADRLNGLREELRVALGPLLRLEASLREVPTGAEGWEANDWRFDEDAERSMGLRPMGRANEAKATKFSLPEEPCNSCSLERQHTPFSEYPATGEASIFTAALKKNSDGEGDAQELPISREMSPAYSDTMLSDEIPLPRSSSRVRVKISESKENSVSGGVSGVPTPSGTESYSTWMQLRVHEIWTAETDSLRARKWRSDRSLTSHSSKSLSRLAKRQSLKGQFRALPAFFVMRPDSIACILWDFICAAAMLHDSVMIPLLSSFDIESTGIVLSFSLASALVWAWDFILSFFRGYINFRTGFVEMRMNYIAYRYLTGWFAPDIALLSLDVMTFFGTSSTDVQSLTLLRLFRSLRLLRLVRMMGRAHLLKEHLTGLEFMGALASVYMETAFSILKHLAIIAFLCHFTGCAWYALGREEVGPSWITVHEAMRDELGLPSDMLYMYSTALHWSLTQFTPAAMEVTATNFIERLFSVFVVLAGLIVFSFFLGSINQALSHLRSRSAQETHQNMLVRRYVADKQISVNLAADVFAFIRQRGLGRARSKVVFGDMKAWTVCHVRC